MSSGMLQDTTQAAPSGSGPRFRPYASPHHHVTKGRYITSNDVRGYIPVYEYPLNGQWIMMDIDDGYILWTGIWKALGNSKADIVKMIDSQPDLAPLIRRVRGGYLKIQGTWMPYEVALKLSRRVAWAIRDDLIPLFGPTFPSTCLSPDQPGYGQVVPSGQGRRRARRATQPVTIIQMPRAPAGWMVVTPNTSTTSAPGAAREHGSPYPPLGPASDYVMHSPYPPHASPRSDAQPDQRRPYSPTQSYANARSPGPAHSSYPPTAFRAPADRPGLSLDMRTLSVREREPPSPRADIRLAPIRAAGAGAGDSPYALPPISALAGLRGGGGSSDSAEVLRRLRMDDDGYPAPAPARGDDGTWGRRHSLSTSKPPDTSPRFQPYGAPRTVESAPYRSRSTSSVGQGYHAPRWSEPSHEGDSTSNPSPTSPATPSSESEDRPPSRFSSSGPRGKHLPGIAGRLSQQWPSQHAHADSPSALASTEAFSIRRNSYEAHSDSDATHPHRPW